MLRRNAKSDLLTSLKYRRGLMSHYNSAPAAPILFHLASVFIKFKKN